MNKYMSFSAQTIGCLLDCFSSEEEIIIFMNTFHEISQNLHQIQDGLHKDLKTLEKDDRKAHIVFSAATMIAVIAQTMEPWIRKLYEIKEALVYDILNEEEIKSKMKESGYTEKVFCHSVNMKLKKNI